MVLEYGPFALQDLRDLGKFAAGGVCGWIRMFVAGRVPGTVEFLCEHSPPIMSVQAPGGLIVVYRELRADELATLRRGRRGVMIVGIVPERERGDVLARLQDDIARISRSGDDT